MIVILGSVVFNGDFYLEISIVGDQRFEHWIFQLETCKCAS